VGDQPVHDLAILCEGGGGEFLIRSHQAAVARHVGSKKGREFSLEACLLMQLVHPCSGLSSRPG
jgi:hypothetical protein